MKSMLFTALLSLGVGHTGAFLGVWNLPYVEDHFTLADLTRKLNAVTKWQETTDSLRTKRDRVAAENYALYDHPPAGPDPRTLRPVDTRVYQPPREMKTRSTVNK